MGREEDEIITSALLSLRAYVKPDKEVDRELERRRMEREAQVDECLIRRGFPGHEVDVREFKGEKWLKFRDMIAASLCRRGTVWLILGGRGRGKTTLTVELGRHVLGSGMSARFIACNEMLATLRATWGESMEKLRSPKLLVVDELAEKARFSEWEREQLTSLVRGRLGDKRDTVMVSNETVGASLKRLGQSIESRLAEGGIVQCNWKSFRHG